MKKRGNRIEYGVQFIWDNHYWHTVPSETIQKVRVIPSKTEGGVWEVVEATGQTHELTGDDIEARAFSVAVAFAEQKAH